MAPDVLRCLIEEELAVGVSPLAGRTPRESPGGGEEGVNGGREEGRVVVVVCKSGCGSVLEWIIEGREGEWLWWCVRGKA